MKHQKRLSRGVLALSLSVGLLAGAGQAWAADPPTKASKMESQEPVTDTWITTKVKSDLLATKDVAGTDVKVETSNGLVSLSGTVATQAEHDKAVEVAKGIKGVKKVDAAQLKVAGHAGH
jgi:hyperosmotically inducible periplasmic protein